MRPACDHSDARAPSRNPCLVVTVVLFAVLVLAAQMVFSAPPPPGKNRVLVKRADFTACADVIQSSRSPLVVQAPLLRYTIASFDPNWFNPDAVRQGAPLFTLRLDGRLASHADKLTLRVRVRADTNLGGNPLDGSLEAFDRVTQPLHAGQVGVPLTSAAVFGLDYQAGGIDFTGSDLHGLIIERRTIPPMNLRFEFSLFCSGMPVVENGMNVRFESTARIRSVRQLRALSPGGDVAASRSPSIFTVTPVFQISSDLLNAEAFEYAPGEARIEVFLHELEEGQDAREAFRGLEFARFAADRFPVTYPSDQPPLVPGKRYAWRARALLRGPESSYRYSNGLQFLVDPRLDNGGGGEAATVLSDPGSSPAQVRYGDDYAKRVTAALEAILGPNRDLMAGDGKLRPAQGLIRLNGRPYTLEELEKLARAFRAGQHRVIGIKFE